MFTVENLIEPLDYEYYIDEDIFADYSVKLAHITVHFEGSTYKLQPLLLGSEQNISALSNDLWKNMAKEWLKEAKYEIESNQFTLKKDVIIPTLSSLIKEPCGNLVDLGCFDGIVTLTAAKPIYFNSYTGLDLIPFPRVEAWQHYKGNVRFVAGSIEKMPFKDNCFDTAIASMTLLNVIKIDKAFLEISRVLKGKATLIIADINSDNYRASGFYHFDKSGWRFIRVFDANKRFFTLKKISEVVPAIHCHNPTSLYIKLLHENEFVISEDFVKGPSVTDIKNSCISQIQIEKALKKYEKEIEYPCFRFLKASKG